jgi:CheY-like chemotaxis protein
MMANFRYRLLVVDDEPAIRDLFQSSLSTEGYEVGVAKDGFGALAQMRGALPDLILTDLKMPNMSGFEFLSIVRRRFPQIPTIAISAEFQPALAPLGVLADAFFAKPFRFGELLAKVAELLQDAPPRPAIKRDRAPVWVPRNTVPFMATVDHVACRGALLTESCCGRLYTDDYATGVIDQVVVVVT